MRKILAITMALMLAAVVLSPAVGYTIQSGGNVSYSIHSNQVNYSIGMGTPAQDITPNMIPPELAPTAAVTATRVPYSIKTGQATPYSLKLANNVTPTVEGATTAPQTAVLGMAAASQPVTSTSNAIPVEQAAAQLNASANATAPAPEAAPAPVEQKFSIMGTVFDDVNNNGVKDTDEMGLASWMINLEQPSGNVIANTTTNESGDYTFSSLNAGEYVVSEVLPMGWAITVPAEGKYTVNLTDSDVKDLNFANLQVPPENVTLPANMTANETMPVNATTNATA